MPGARQLVKKHTEKGGIESHIERNPEGIHEEIRYRLFDCRYCGAEGIASKADFDIWEEVWPDVKTHLRHNHLSELDN